MIPYLLLPYETRFSIRQFQFLQELLGVRGEFFMHFHGSFVARFAQNDLLVLHEFVDAAEQPGFHGKMHFQIFDFEQAHERKSEIRMSKSERNPKLETRTADQRVIPPLLGQRGGVDSNPFNPPMNRRAIFFGRAESRRP